MAENYWQNLGRRRYGRRTVLAASGGAGALMLAGCGDDDDTPATQAPGGTAPGASAPAATPTPVDLSKLSEEEFLNALPENPPKDWKDEDIKPGGRLVRLIPPGVAATFDPVGVTTQAAGENYQSVYSRLVRFSCRQGMKSVVLPEIEGDLATAWEQPDPQTLIFKLAPNIKWQNAQPVNGRAFTAEDIVYSYNRAKTAQFSVQKSQVSIFETVSALPDGRVQIKLARPSLSAFEVVAQFYSAIVPRELGEDPDKAKVLAVGTGGMMVKSHTPNVETVYDKNPDFFKTDAQGRKKPYLDGYTLQIFQDVATLRAAILAKRGDFSYSSSNALPGIQDLFDFYKQAKGLALQLFPAAAVSFTISPHADRPPFNDVRVRQALTRAIPHEKMIKALHKGKGMVAPYFPWPYVLDKAPGPNDLGPNYKFDPKEVKALLSAAGFPNGVDWDLVYYPTTEPLVVPLQQELLESGIRLKLVREPDLASITRRQTAKEWKDLLTFGRGLPFVNPSATFGVYLKGNTSLNFTDFTDPKFEDLWTRFNAATKPEEQKTLGKEMWTELLAKVPDAPLSISSRLYIEQPWVKNVVETSWAAQVGFGMGQMDSVWRTAAT